MSDFFGKGLFLCTNRRKTVHKFFQAQTSGFRRYRLTGNARKTESKPENSGNSKLSNINSFKAVTGGVEDDKPVTFLLRLRVSGQNPSIFYQYTPIKF